MDEAEYGRATDPLTPTERRRLRSSVDPDALERLIVAMGGEIRRGLIVHFATEITNDDLRAALTEMGADDEIAQLERGVEAANDVSDLPRVAHAAQVPGAVAHVTIPTTDFVWQIELPEDPVLRVLWNEVEPSRRAE